MISPYKAYLAEYEDTDNQVTLHRNGASDITGKVMEVTDFGVTLKTPQKGETAIKTFVVFEDIRGVATEIHDPV